MGVPGFGVFIGDVIAGNPRFGYRRPPTTHPEELKDLELNLIRTIAKKQEKIEQTLGKLADNFYIDLNGLIHPCCHPEVGPKPKDEKEMLQRIEDEIINLVRFVGPKKVLYLAIDGVAPFAKQEQQRKRRFGAVGQRATINNCKAEMGLELSESWDHNQISPGTYFMTRVIEKINNTITKLLEEFPELTIIFSDASVPGEGEHKLMAFIKGQQIKLGEEFNEQVHIVHGLDADLIMLSSILKMKYVYALRDRQDKAANKKTRDVFDINLFCRALINFVLDAIYELLKDKELFKKYYDKFNYSNMICDMILAFMFGGNDFLPSLPNLSMYNQGIIRQLAAYASYLKDQIENGEEISYLIDLSTAEIRIDRLGKCFSSVADSSIIELFTRMVLSTKRNEYFEDLEPNKPRNIHQFEKYLNKMSKKQAINSRYSSVGKVFDECRRAKTFDPFTWDPKIILKYKDEIIDEYYEVKFGKDCDRMKIAKCFLEGLQWTFKYYLLSEPPSWSYCYDYYFGPTMVDICKACEELTKSGKTVLDPMEKGEILNPFQQLISILPFESMEHCLPKKVTEAITNDESIKQYFPKEFALDAYFNKLPHTYVALLPSFGTDVVKKVFKIIEPLLTEEEKKSLEVGVDRIYFTSKMAEKVIKSVNGSVNNKKKDNGIYNAEYVPATFTPSELTFSLEGISNLKTRPPTEVGSLISSCIISPFKFICKAFDRDFGELSEDLYAKQGANKRKQRGYDDSHHNEKKRKDNLGSRKPSFNKFDNKNGRNKNNNKFNENRDNGDVSERKPIKAKRRNNEHQAPATKEVKESSEINDKKPKEKKNTEPTPKPKESSKSINGGEDRKPIKAKRTDKKNNEQQAPPTTTKKAKESSSDNNDKKRKEKKNETKEEQPQTKKVKQTPKESNTPKNKQEALKDLKDALLKRLESVTKNAKKK
ncbi:hypothetical protein ABK040_002988 [Willaertia magna]